MAERMNMTIAWNEICLDGSGGGFIVGGVRFYISGTKKLLTFFEGLHPSVP